MLKKDKGSSMDTENSKTTTRRLLVKFNSIKRSQKGDLIMAFKKINLFNYIKIVIVIIVATAAKKCNMYTYST